jgi:hypothetical protein
MVRVVIVVVIVVVAVVVDVPFEETGADSTPGEPMEGCWVRRDLTSFIWTGVFILID